MVKKISTSGITTLTEIEKKSLFKLKERLSEVFRLRELILFGSKARGDHEECSDIDLLVLVEDEKNRNNRELLSDITLDINLEFDTQFTCILENANQWEAEDKGIWLPLKDNIEEEGLSIEI